jgi:N-acetylmuramoyl-L-alanine amidase
MPSPLRRAFSLPRLGVAAVGALLLAFVPLLPFTWAPSAITENLLPHFEAAGAQELPAPAAGDTVTADRKSSVQTGLEPFTAIGLKLQVLPTETIYARTHSASGWSTWRDFDVTTVAGKHGTDQVVNEEPIWVKDADGYELNVPSAIADSTQVVLIRDGVHRVLSTATPLAGAETPPFGVHTRGEWGARPYNGTPDYGDSIKLAVVHHSDSPNTYAPGDVPSILRSIQAFHMDANGWADIGYNLVVDKYGGIWEGRGGGMDRPVIGAHAQGFNTNSVGVMVIGDYTTAQPTAAALESVSNVIGWKMFLSGNDPNGRIDFTSGGSPKYAAGVVVNLPRVVGHQDVGLTACPGSIEGYLGQIRSRAQDWKNYYTATSKPFGAINSVSAGAGTVTVSGWAIDPNKAGAPSNVLLGGGGTGLTVTADQPRPDVAAAYPSYGPNHGFTATMTGVVPGWITVCVSALNDSNGYGNAVLGCPWAKVGDPTGQSPSGYIGTASGTFGGFHIGGAVRDGSAPDTPLSVDLELDGTVIATTRTTGGPGAFGFDVAGVVGGDRHVCTIAHNIGAGFDTRFDCTTVHVTPSGPIGRWDWLGSNSQGDIGLFGWVWDVETLNSLNVEVLIDRSRRVIAADQPRPDVAGMGVPAAYGVRKGFALTAHVGVGQHTVCVNPIDYPSGQLGTFGCRNIVVK